MGGANSLLRRGAGAAAAARAPPTPLTSRPEAAAPPAPVLTGAAHFLFEASLGHPWRPEEPGLLARSNFVWNLEGPAVVRRRLPPGLLCVLEIRREQEGALVRRYQLSMRVQLRARMEMVEQIGDVVFLASDAAAYWYLCAFCDHPFVGLRLRVLPCGHAFHSACVDFHYILGNDGWHHGPPCPACGAPVLP